MVLKNFKPSVGWGGGAFKCNPNEGHIGPFGKINKKQMFS